jgi:hypothetical protein
VLLGKDLGEDFTEDQNENGDDYGRRRRADRLAAAAGDAEGVKYIEDDKRGSGGSRNVGKVVADEDRGKRDGKFINDAIGQSRSFAAGKAKTAGVLPGIPLADPISGSIRKEPVRVEKARQQAVNATQPREAQL